MATSAGTTPVDPADSVHVVLTRWYAAIQAFDSAGVAASLAKDFLPSTVATSGLQAIVFGLVLILFIIFEPLGLYGRWLKIRTWFELFPFYRRGMFRRQKAYMKSERLR